jgi:pimeloyl-ACP methyl ester carboxylesterase
MLVLAALLLAAPAAQAADGVVLLHGKNGTPDRFIANLAAELERVGFIVERPEMPWSRQRGFDAGYEQAMAEIDAAVARLKMRGALRVAVAGHSLGGNAALGYAARRPGLWALIALAPAHTPELNAQRLAPSLAKAREMAAAGRGKEKAGFTDVNMGKEFAVTTTPDIYLSYHDPAGPALMPANAAAIAKPLPILWVVGERDKLTRPAEYAFAKATAHPASRYLSLPADHTEAPDVAAEAVVEWLQGLPR